MAQKLLLFLFVFSYWCAPYPVFGQQAVDFSTALELAKKNNPDWRAAEQEVEVVRGRLTTARLISPFNPVIEGQGGPRRMPGDGTGGDYGVGVSMEIEVAGQRGARITEAERNLQKVEAGFQDFARTFRGRLARAFYQAIFARERLALQRRVEDLNRSLADVTKIKFDAGDVSGLEVNVATVRYGQSRKETLDAERNLTQTLLELRRLIGTEQTYLPEGKLAIAVPTVSAAAILEVALVNRPDLLARRHELRRAEAEIALVKRQVLPNPIFGLSFNREGSGDKVFLGGVTIPLPVFNRAQGELESLEARKIQARAELLALEKEIEKEVNQVINEWETARQNAGLFQREIIAQVDENFRLLEAAYRERRIDLPQLLVMENNLVDANQSYLDVLSSLRIRTGVELSHIFVNLKPKDEWSTASTHEELVEKFGERLAAEVPGVVFGFTHPIELRFNELIAGVRADIALKIFGDDLERLKDLGDQAAGIIGKIEGAADVRAEQTAGLPLLNIKVDRERAARYGINAEEVMAAVEAGGAGRVVGMVFEGQRRFGLAVRLKQDGKLDPQSFASIPVAAKDGLLIPLGQVAAVSLQEGPVLVSREDLQRRIVVQLNVRGRDLGSFIADAQQAIQTRLKLPEGYYVEWGGQFENLERRAHDS